MEIREVKSRAELRRFIGLPYHLYRSDPNWVPPLRREQWAQFDPKSNPMLSHCEYALFLLLDGDRAVGRVAAFLDRLALKTWGEPIGLFGSFECPDDAEGAAMLLGAARTWLQAHGSRKMRGPWSFASQEWGIVIEGFEPPPVILAPYNPSYYRKHLEDFGLGKIKDLLVYYADSAEGYEIPERYLLLTEKVKDRYGVRVRHIDMSRLAEEVAMIVKLANQAIAGNWGFYPVTEAEGLALARDMKQIVNPDAVLIAENDRGEAIGFAMSLPDINLILRGMNGRLLPFGWFKLLRGLPRLKQYRMWALGVVPEYQGKAVDALLYRHTYEALHTLGVRLEINYVLEDNAPMNNALKNLGVKDLRRYRVYEMAI